MCGLLCDCWLKAVYSSPCLVVHGDVGSPPWTTREHGELIATATISCGCFLWCPSLVVSRKVLRKMLGVAEGDAFF